MGVALAAVANNGNGLVFDQINVSVTVKINTHLTIPLGAPPVISKPDQGFYVVHIRRLRSCFELIANPATLVWHELPPSRE